MAGINRKSEGLDDETRQLTDKNVIDFDMLDDDGAAVNSQTLTRGGFDQNIQEDQLDLDSGLTPVVNSIDPAKFLSDSNGLFTLGLIAVGGFAFFKTFIRRT
jgi:hypothetical protein